jgi:radical SAM protein (TIGR01212 family)
MNEPYFSFAAFLRNRFPGQKVVKIPLHGGFACPNKDGALDTKGCVFCDDYASGPIHFSDWPIERQIQHRMAAHPGKKFIAYFQSHCNTYGPVRQLRAAYEKIFKFGDIVGLAIGTRPDTLPEPVLLLLQELNRRTFLTVELGLQSIHEKSLTYLNRNHTFAQFLDAFHRLQSRNIATVAHLIVGIPGESRSDMLATIEAMNRLKPQGIKFHLLHILKNTTLHQRCLATPFPLLSREEYADLIVLLLDHLDPGIVIHRLSAEREKELFIAPQWALNKQAVLNAIRQRLRETGAYQGRRFSG